MRRLLRDVMVVGIALLVYTLCCYLLSVMGVLSCGS